MKKIAETQSVHIKSNLNIWQNTLPRLAIPNDDESLYSYLLKLDSINNFSPGSILDIIKNHNTGRVSLNRPGLFTVATVLNLPKLCELINLGIDDMLKLTLIPVIKKIFRVDNIYPKLIGYSPFFKICPNCIAEKNLPLVHVFNNISICFKHNTLLHHKCLCGNQVKIFSIESDSYCCPYCCTPYATLPIVKADVKNATYKKQLFYNNIYNSLLHDNISLIHDHEDIKAGFENRLQYLANLNEIPTKQIKNMLGYEISLTKNGHGLSNLSISKIAEMLYFFNCTVREFRDLEFAYNAQKIQSVHFKAEEKSVWKCPNIYCKYYNQKDKGNVKHYGNKTLKSDEVITERYCKVCGTRFIGNDIIQSYDYNPGLRVYDIERARSRISIWQEKLKNTCNDMIKQRVPITLTGAFKTSGIPIGKSYFADRLGLIAILEEYAQKQKEDFKKWSHELIGNEASFFLRRIYKRKNN
ncbi:TniQ protein [Natronincola peptidivorans]|uniref:TniQ protein n=1 Tax=Natronincola peptidivorans TaxID=426128 RepID=A0A1I0FU56_9FIRM|nr:TniQ family protein [Natronincola peptidivorans]SET61910.1 TniQ protein [Natronincola peptidivorans]